MSFTITCDKCGNKLTVKDKNYYISEETIDLFPYNESDQYGITTFTLDIYCNNKECKNHVDIGC